MRDTNKNDLIAQGEKIISDNITTEIKRKRFKDKRTGEIVTQFNILDIEYFEELKE